MSMTLKKRREESIAAELVATNAELERLKREEEEEGLDGLGVGRKGFGGEIPNLKVVVEEGSQSEDKESERDDERGERGRRGRSSKSPSSESPEGMGFEE